MAPKSSNNVAQIQPHMLFNDVESGLSKEELIFRVIHFWEAGTQQKVASSYFLLMKRMLYLSPTCGENEKQTETKINMINTNHADCLCIIYCSYIVICVPWSPTLTFQFHSA